MPSQPTKPMLPLGLRYLYAGSSVRKTESASAAGDRHWLAVFRQVEGGIAPADNKFNCELRRSLLKQSQAQAAGRPCLHLLPVVHGH